MIHKKTHTAMTWPDSDLLGQPEIPLEFQLCALGSLQMTTGRILADTAAEVFSVPISKCNGT